MDITSYAGDWLYDEYKLSKLTKERAIQDLAIISDSPDYDDEDFTLALDVATRELKIGREALFFGTMIKRYAYKMSKV